MCAEPVSLQSNSLGEPALEESRDRHLVGGIERRWRRTARLRRRACHHERGEPDQVGRLEFELRGRHQIERCCIDALPLTTAVRYIASASVLTLDSATYPKPPDNNWNTTNTATTPVSRLAILMLCNTRIIISICRAGR